MTPQNPVAYILVKFGKLCQCQRWWQTRIERSILVRAAVVQIIQLMSLATLSPRVLNVYIICSWCCNSSDKPFWDIHFIYFSDLSGMPLQSKICKRHRTHLSQWSFLQTLNSVETLKSGKKFPPYLKFSVQRLRENIS